MFFVRGYSLTRNTVQAGGKPAGDDVEAGGVDGSAAADMDEKTGGATRIEASRRPTEKPREEPIVEDTATTVGEPDGKDTGSEEGQRIRETR